MNQNRVIVIGAVSSAEAMNMLKKSIELSDFTTNPVMIKEYEPLKGTFSQHFTGSISLDDLELEPIDVAGLGLSEESKQLLSDMSDDVNRMRLAGVAVTDATEAFEKLGAIACDFGKGKDVEVRSVIPPTFYKKRKY